MYKYGIKHSLIPHFFNLTNCQYAETHLEYFKCCIMNKYFNIMKMGKIQKINDKINRHGESGFNISITYT